ncbi:hypothetical protein HA402_004477 [Bradysia odoriphaga]|nr:hypothetical protein HA402_004477 [Bradysia odoriphaga]
MGKVVPAQGAGKIRALKCEKLIGCMTISTCNICKKEIPGDHLGNLTKHVFQHHRAVYDEYADEEDFVERDAVPPKKRKITVEYDPAEVQNDWLNLIVKEGRPFVILDSQALKNLLSPIFGALEIDMLTSRNVQVAISLRAEAVMNEIKDVLRNRIFSLKIDSATRHNRRVICLNAQIVISGVIKIFTLAMSEMQINSGRHTGKNIKLFVLAVLQKYGLKIEQIYSITQDNGRNFILAGKMLTYDKFQLRNESTESREIDSEEEDSDAGSEDDDNEADVVTTQAIEDDADDNCVDWQPNTPAANNTLTSSDINNNNNDTNDGEDNKILENYINELYAEIDEDNHSSDEDDSAAWHLICNFKDKMPLSTNVLKYWHEKRFTHPLLFKLSTIVFGVPASQRGCKLATCSLDKIRKDAGKTGQHRTRSLEDHILSGSHFWPVWRISSFHVDHAILVCSTAMKPTIQLLDPACMRAYATAGVVFK